MSSVPPLECYSETGFKRGLSEITSSDGGEEYFSDNNTKQRVDAS